MNTLTAISLAATKQSLSFLLAGGHAVILHGFPRNTFDLDLIVRREDRGAWTRLLTEMGYIFFSEGPTFLQFNAPDETTLPIDLMLSSEATFAKLLEQSRFIGSEKNVRMVSLHHLLAMKCHAIKHGHAGRIVKDVDDVIRLIQINRLDLNEAALRELILEHGTEELYEKLRRA